MKPGTNTIDPMKIVPARGYFLFLTEERKAEKNGIKVAFLDEQTNDWGKCVKMGQIGNGLGVAPYPEMVKEVEDEIRSAGYGTVAQHFAIFIAACILFAKRFFGSHGHYYDPGFREGDRVMVAKLSGRKQFDKRGREYLVLPFSEVSAYVPSNKQVSGQAG